MSLFEPGLACFLLFQLFYASAPCTSQARVRFQRLQILICLIDFHYAPWTFVSWVQSLAMLFPILVHISYFIFHAIFHVIPFIFMQLLKFITNRKIVQISSKFFPHSCCDVYYILMLISWFDCGWIFNCVCVIEHDTKMICYANCSVKCSWFVQFAWNLTC